MDMDTYQERTGETQLAASTSLEYLLLGLASEVGEVCDKRKKNLRDRDGHITTLTEDEIARELGDVLWYVARIADKLNYSLDLVADMNLKKLASRKERGAIQGSGDHR